MMTVKEINHDLDIAASIAGDALSGLTDQAGAPMVWHASELAGDLARAGRGTTTVAVALLHDVLEDSDWNAKRLYHELVTRGSSKLDQKAIVRNVLVLTRRQGEETYAEYIDRVREASDIATTVKISDLRHHLENKKDIADSLVKRYQKALSALTSPGATK